MNFFAQPFQGLPVTQMKKSNKPYKVINDVGEQYGDEFATTYNDFKQSNFIQLPDTLIKASDIANHKAKFEVLNREELMKEKLRAAAAGRPEAGAAFDDLSSSADLSDLDNQTYSGSELNDGFKVPSSRVNASTRDYNNYKVDESDASTDSFDNKSVISDSDSLRSSVINKKTSKKFL